MNIAFFLKPKSQVAYLHVGNTLRQGLEKMRHHGFTAVPVIARNGTYLGSVSEGDFLRRILELGTVENAVLESICIDSILNTDRCPPVRITATMEDLLERAQEQNFVPVVDDRGSFMGIVTRHDILCYFTEHRRRQQEEQNLESRETK